MLILGCGDVDGNSSACRMSQSIGRSDTPEDLGTVEGRGVVRLRVGRDPENESTCCVPTYAPIEKCRSGQGTASGTMGVLLLGRNPVSFHAKCVVLFTGHA